MFPDTLAWSAHYFTRNLCVLAGLSLISSLNLLTVGPTGHCGLCSPSQWDVFLLPLLKWGLQYLFSPQSPSRKTSNCILNSFTLLASMALLGSWGCMLIPPFSWRNSADFTYFLWLILSFLLFPPPPPFFCLLLSRQFFKLLFHWLYEPVPSGCVLL